MPPDVTPVQPKRFYARRLPMPFTRTSQLSIRVSPAMLDSLKTLADPRSMSLSEYTARLLMDHLHAQPQ